MKYLLTLGLMAALIIGCGGGKGGGGGSGSSSSSSSSTTTTTSYHNDNVVANDIYTSWEGSQANKLTEYNANGSYYFAVQKFTVVYKATKTKSSDWWKSLFNFNVSINTGSYYYNTDKSIKSYTLERVDATEIFASNGQCQLIVPQLQTLNSSTGIMQASGYPLSTYVTANQNDTTTERTLITYTIWIYPEAQKAAYNKQIVNLEISSKSYVKDEEEGK